MNIEIATGIGQPTDTEQQKNTLTTDNYYHKLLYVKICDKSILLTKIFNNLKFLTIKKTLFLSSIENNANIAFFIFALLLKLMQDFLRFKNSVIDFFSEKIF